LQASLFAHKFPSKRPLGSPFFTVSFAESTVF
jgi:hypothetical protein